MIKRTLPLLIGLSACGFVFAQDMPASAHSAATVTQTTTATSRTTPPPTGTLSESEINTAIADAGYQEVKDLEFEDGVWQAEARGGNDQWIEVTVGPTTGKVYVSGAPSRLNQAEITAKLTGLGYRNVHDVEYEDGLWSVDAESKLGTDVDLLVDPDDGSVVSAK